MVTDFTKEHPPNTVEDSVREKMMKRLLMCCIALSTMAVQSAMAQTTAKDVQRWESECAQGRLPPACSLAALAYDNGEGVRQDKFKAVELYTKACDGGSAGGCLNLGVMYSNGEGVRQDTFKAVELFTKACDGGSANGCLNLGVMYVKGEGVKLDKKRALALVGKACDLKSEKGCQNYATPKGQGH